MILLAPGARAPVRLPAPRGPARSPASCWPCSASARARPGRAPAAWRTCSGSRRARRRRRVAGADGGARPGGHDRRPCAGSARCCSASCCCSACSCRARERLVTLASTEAGEVAARRRPLAQAATALVEQVRGVTEARVRVRPRRRGGGRMKVRASRARPIDPKQVEGAVTRAARRPHRPVRPQDAHRRAAPRREGRVDVRASASASARRRSPSSARRSPSPSPARSSGTG